MVQPFGEYRGCTLLLYPAVRETPARYGSSCTIYLRSDIDRVKADIDALLGPAEEPEPEPEVDHVEETYRGVTIWHKVAQGVFWAQVATGYTAQWSTLSKMHSTIDEILEFLEPDEDPGEGLFAQVVAAVKVWVQRYLPDWVLEFGRVINNVINNITENITNVYNTISEYVTNVYNYVTENITNVYNTTKKYITNITKYITEEITNVINNTYNYVTNIIGITQEALNQGLSDNRAWVTAFFKLMDPMGFLKDPLGTINAAFTIQREIAGNKMIGSFLEGLEEGLEE